MQPFSFSSKRAGASRPAVAVAMLIVVAMFVASIGLR
jgi:hypothetical protein